jgi:hypothetical protein
MNVNICARCFTKYRKTESDALDASRFHSRACEISAVIEALKSTKLEAYHFGSV